MANMHEYAQVSIATEFPVEYNSTPHPALTGVAHAQQTSKGYLDEQCVVRQRGNPIFRRRAQTTAVARTKADDLTLSIRIAAGMAGQKL